jgi:hypothetical protein
MKKILVAAMLLFTMTAFSQEIEFSKNFDVKAGVPYKVIDARSKEYFSDGKGNIITVKTDGEEVYIQKINTKSQKEVSRKFYKDFPKYTKVQKVAKFGDRLFYFYAVYDKKNKREAVYAREIDITDGSFEKPTFLFKTSGVVIPQVATESLGFWGFGSGPKFNFYNSFDNTKFMIQYRVKPTTKRDKNSYDKLGFYVFNMSDISKVWGKESKMPYTEAKMNNITYTVSSEGNAYMIAYKREEKKFELLEITKASTTVETNPIDLDGSMFFSKILIKEDSDGNLNCSGYYANGMEVTYSWVGGLSTQMNVNGVLQFSLNKSGKILSENKIEFPAKLINQFESKRAKKKNDKREADGKLGIRDLVLREVIEQEDGTTIIIGEQYYMKTEQRGTSSVTYFYYADIVATKIDKDGNTLWMKKLPKTQKGARGKGGMGFKYASKGDNIYLMYLDNVKNLAMGVNDVPKIHMDGKGGFLTAYKIDNETGDIEKQSILDTRDMDGLNAYQFKTSRLLLANENELFLEVYIKGKKDVLVKIELND